MFVADNMRSVALSTPAPVMLRRFDVGIDRLGLVAPALKALQSLPLRK